MRTSTKKRLPAAVPEVFDGVQFQNAGGVVATPVSWVLMLIDHTMARTGMFILLRSRRAKSSAVAARDKILRERPSPLD